MYKIICTFEIKFYIFYSAIGGECMERYLDIFESLYGEIINEISSNLYKNSKEYKDKIQKCADIVDEYPNFLDDTWTLDDIQAFCDEYGVNVTFVPKQTEDYPENTIIEQSRAAGDPIIKGANLKITYAVKYQESIEEKPDAETDNEDNEQTN